MPTSDSDPPRKPAAKTPPGRGPDAAAREVERKTRLAAALRENLRRRKARGRQEPDGGNKP